MEKNHCHSFKSKLKSPTTLVVTNLIIFITAKSNYSRIFVLANNTKPHYLVTSFSKTPRYSVFSNQFTH